MFAKEILFFLLSYPLFVDAIIGGEDVTKPHEYPWMVGIVTYDVENDQPTNFGSCGGAIISENMILTAAHCVEDGWSESDRGREYSKKTGIFVKIGHSLSSQRISVKVKSKLIHPNYGSFEKHQYAYDIALLELSEDLKFNEEIQPIALPEENVDETNYLDKSRSKLLVAGWGTTFDIPNDFYPLVKSRKWTVQKSKIPKEKYFKYCETPEYIKSTCEGFDYQTALQGLKTVKPGEVQLFLQQVTICQNQESSKCEDNVKFRYPETLKVTEIDYIKLGNDKKEKMPVVIHARSTKPNIPGPCNGDSGGPLMKLDKISGKFEVVGIVSGLKSPKKLQGPRGCLGTSPGVYGRVSSFVPWIKENMAKASNPDLFMQLYQPCESCHL
jgi:hypothetical protein